MQTRNPLTTKTSGSFDFIAMKDTLLKSPNELSSTSAYSFSMFDENGLLMAPMIETPKSLLSRPVDVCDRYVMDMIKSPSHDGSTTFHSPHPTLSIEMSKSRLSNSNTDSNPSLSPEVDDLRLMICHRDFPRLFTLAKLVQSIHAVVQPERNTNGSLISTKVTDAVDHIKDRFSGKNLTILPGQYPSIDFMIQGNFAILKQELETATTLLPNNHGFHTCSSSTVPTVSSTFDPEKISEWQFDVLMKWSIESSKCRGTTDLSHLEELSKQTRMAIPDIVAWIASCKSLKASGGDESNTASMKKRRAEQSETVVLRKSPRLSAMTASATPTTVRKSPRLAALAEPLMSTSSTIVRSASSKRSIKPVSDRERPEKDCKRGFGPLKKRPVIKAGSAVKEYSPTDSSFISGSPKTPAPRLRLPFHSPTDKSNMAIAWTPHPSSKRLDHSRIFPPAEVTFGNFQGWNEPLSEVTCRSRSSLAFYPALYAVPESTLEKPLPFDDIRSIASPIISPKLQATPQTDNINDEADDIWKWFIDSFSDDLMLKIINDVSFAMSPLAKKKRTGVKISTAGGSIESASKEHANSSLFKVDVDKENETYGTNTKPTVKFV